MQPRQVLAPRPAWLIGATAARAWAEHGRYTAVKAIGFDLGETLIYYRDVPLSWQSLYREALIGTARACNCQVDEERIGLAEQVLARYNTRLHPRLEEVTSDLILGEILSTWGMEGEPLLRAAIEAFFSFFQRGAAAYDDTLPALAFLKERGDRVGVLTDVPYGMSRSYVERDLIVTGLAGYVDVLITSVDVGQRKPGARGYVELAKSLGVAPGDMVYVGSEQKEIVGAAHAGIRSVLVDRSGGVQTYGETQRIGSLLPLQQIT